MKKRLLEITDPIHDFIQLDKTEHKIIDTPVFKGFEESSSYLVPILHIQGHNILDLSTPLVYCTLHQWLHPH